MKASNWKTAIQPFDQRRDLVIPGDEAETVRFCTTQWIELAQEAIQERGCFIVALSGGQTPHAIFKSLSQAEHQKRVDWSKVLLFWSDERDVPLNHPESNYFMAMEAGLKSLPFDPKNIFPVPREQNREEAARLYEEQIRAHVPSLQFDLIMLGMGEDGHTASLFPYTDALHANHRLFVANNIPQKQVWRLTMTYACMDLARTICIYVMGEKKKERVAEVLLEGDDSDRLPVQRVGTPTHKALWILDRAAASLLVQRME